MDDQVKFDLVENALDYLLSAAEHAEKEIPRDWKYAVLHLVAGVELILKARLEKEHWSLLFAQVDKASRANLASGDFISVNFETACQRLKAIANVNLDQESLKHLTELRKRRNNAQHFKVNLDIATVKSLLAHSMSFSVEFCRSELGAYQEERWEETLGTIHKHLVNLQEFVDARLEAILPALDGVMVRECPECWQETVAIGESTQSQCAFCGADVAPRALASFEGPSEDCPHCCAEGAFGIVLYNNEEGDWVCFSCGHVGGEYDHCPRCGNLYPRSENVMCEPCWASIMGVI